MSTPKPDIVSQLREWIPQESICTCADLIGAAAAEIERLRQALEWIRFNGSTPSGDLINQSAKVAAYALQDETAVTLGPGSAPFPLPTDLPSVYSEPECYCRSVDPQHRSGCYAAKPCRLMGGPSLRTADAR